MIHRYRTLSRLFGGSVVVIISAFVVHAWAEYQQYLLHPEYSAPYSVHLINLGTMYITPFLVCLFLAHQFRKKWKALLMEGASDNG